MNPKAERWTTHISIVASIRFFLVLDGSHGRSTDVGVVPFSTHQYNFSSFLQLSTESAISRHPMVRIVSWNTIKKNVFKRVKLALVTPIDHISLEIGHQERCDWSWMSVAVVGREWECTLRSPKQSVWRRGVKRRINHDNCASSSTSWKFWTASLI